MTDWYRANRDLQFLIADAREIAHRLGVLLDDLGEGQGREPGPDQESVQRRASGLRRDTERLGRSMAYLRNEVVRLRQERSDPN